MFRELFKSGNAINVQQSSKIVQDLGCSFIFCHAAMLHSLKAWSINFVIAVPCVEPCCCRRLLAGRLH